MTDQDIQVLAELTTLALEGNAEARELCSRAWGAVATPELLTQSQLAERLQVTTRTVRALGLPRVMVGRVPRYDLAAVKRALTLTTS